jgi:hypothetical protein
MENEMSNEDIEIKKGIINPMIECWLRNEGYAWSKMFMFADRGELYKYRYGCVSSEYGIDTYWLQEYSLTDPNIKGE